MAKKVQQVEQDLKGAEERLDRIREFSDELRDKIEQNETVITAVAEDADKVVQLQKLTQYLRLVRDIQDISNELKTTINGSEETKMVELYLTLCGDSYNESNLLGRSFETEAPNLKLFARSTAFYWHDLLKEKFAFEFEKILKKLHWPQRDLWNPSKDTLQRLQQLAQLLFMVRIPGDKGLLNLKLTPYVICPPLSSPIEVLLKAYKDRFKYHFNSERETNRLDKPEWYLTQILAWATKEHLFVAENFQLPAIRAGVVDIDVRLEFIRGMVQFGVEKLCDDIDDFSEDEALFSHMLDEVLAFEAELEEMLGHRRPDDFPSLITVITQPEYLARWLSIEQTFASDKMDYILESTGAFELLGPANEEKLKIPRCADQFIRLLEAVRERYSNLPQPRHRLQFLDLQIELVDTFQQRMVELLNDPETDVNRVQVLNALNYVIFVLQEWGESVHYLHLLTARHGLNLTEADSVFEPILKELEKLQTNLLRSLASRLVDDVKAKSMAYRHSNWSELPELDTNAPIMLSTTAGEMFQQLVTLLHKLEDDLSENLFQICIRIVAKRLDDYMMDSMVMVTRFSKGGAKQFHFDMTRNLFALFGLYARNPVQLFKSLIDACELLTLPYGTASLLYDTMVKHKPMSEISITALREIGIYYLEPITAFETLERRLDLND